MFDVKHDMARGQALAEILCGAAEADEELDPDEATAVQEELRDLLAVDALPPEIEKHVRTFNQKRFDLIDSLARLRLSDISHKKALLRSVRTILRADGIMRDVERDYFIRLAHNLRVHPSDIE